MLGSVDRVPEDPVLDNWGRTERERDSIRPKSADAYDVGYGKPPRTHQFRPGQSGNPHGRPKRQRGPVLPASLNDAIVRELSRKHTITVAGKKKKLSMDKVIAKRVVSSLATCDPKLLPGWLSALQRAGFPLAVDEMREREEEKMRIEYEARVEVFEKLELYLEEHSIIEPYEGHADDIARARQAATDERAKGPRKPRY